MAKGKKVKENRGGSGRGQGRHLKYGEATKNVSFRCPVSKIEQLKKLVNAALAGWSQGSS
jgi:hypothetical protein